MEIKQLFYVFVGGGLGSMVRFSLGKYVNAFHNHAFPFGTFAVNILACFALGFIVGLADHKQMLSSASRLFWAIGFCGGFSTFSTFSQETLTLFQSGQNTTMLSYILLSVLLCVSATFGGLVLAERI